MLISLRGTNGSGKSTVIRTLLEKCISRKPIYGALGPKQPEAYKLRFTGCKVDVYLLGPYITPTGGCDRLQYNQILDLLNKYEPLGHVLFEGIIVTSVYGRVGELMEKCKQNSVFVFLDTPLEVCLKRIEARREGKPRDERLIRNVSGKYKSSEAVKKRVTKEKIMRCHTVSGDKAPELILNLIRHG